MNSDILFILAIVAFYVLQQLAARRKQQQGGPGAPLPPHEVEAAGPDDELGDALAEIRRALGMETEPAPPRPARFPDEFHRIETGRPDEEERFERKPSPAVTGRGAFEDRIRPTPTYDDAFEKAAPYRAMPPSSEDRFERQRTLFRDPLEGHSHVAPIHVPLDRPLPPPQKPATASARLRTRSQLREAFVLKEIVGPPRSRKREIR